MPVKYGSLPFTEAIDYLQGKVNLPTQSWTDIWEGQHAKAFTVAGATKEELLTDLHSTINKAIDEGMTIDQFRAQFDDIVKRHGWSYNGGRNWRSRVIYETNMRTAYMAGRYEQLQAVKKRRPYWQYDHSDFVTHPRPEHEAWDGLVIHADNPWWDTHYPPNGWGCRCSVRALSKRDLKRLGKDGPDEAPPLELEEKTVGVRGPNPRTVDVPKGIDPGWGYNVGKANTGQVFADEEWAQWQLDNKHKQHWFPVLTRKATDWGRPRNMPLFPAPAALGKPVDSKAEMVTAMKSTLGGDSKIYTAAGYPVLVDATWVGEHTDYKRAKFLPFLDDLLTDPYETWLNWERHAKTGAVRLSVRMVKAYRIGKSDKGIVIATQVSGGKLRAHTFLPTSNLRYISDQRLGVLLQGAKDDD